MSNLRTIIQPIIAWGTTPKLAIENKNNTLKQSLISLYQEYLSIAGTVEEDETEYPEAPDFNFEKISNTIRSNFPDLGFYQTILDPFNLEKPDHGLGDSNDDLSDIIKDLMEVQWRFQHTSTMDAVWYFEFIMRNNSERHLVNLLKTLKDYEEQV